MRVIRRDVGGDDASRLVSYAAAAAGGLALLVWYTRSLTLTLWTLAGVAGVLLVFGTLAVLLLRGSRLVGTQAASYWRLALAGLQRRSRESVAQVLIFGLAVMLLAVLVTAPLALLAVMVPVPLALPIRPPASPKPLTLPLAMLSDTVPVGASQTWTTTVASP